MKTNYFKATFFRTKIIIVLILLSIQYQSNAQNKKFTKIDSLLNYLNGYHKFMGQVCINEGDETVFQKTYGYLEPGQKIFANKSTKYKIGSVTKMFTSVMILQLIQDKKLKLDTKLSQFYPKIANADGITINDLLHHRSGILSITSDPEYAVFRTQENTKESLIDRINKYEPVFEPNTKSDYSNTNYILLGYIIEDITQKKYAEILEQKIIKPLELKNTQMGHDAVLNQNETLSYTYKNKQWVKTPEENMSLPQGAGAIQSTAYDLNVFIHALFSGKLIKKSTLQEMITLEDGYGKGIFKMPFGNKYFYGHNGGIDDFRSLLQYYPSEKLSVSIIKNGGDFDVNNILTGVLSIYYKMPYQFPNVISIDVAPEILKKYVGVYSTAQIPLKVTVRLRDNNTLTAQATGQSEFPLNPISQKEFVFDQGGIKITFSNKETMVLKQGSNSLLFTKEKEKEK